MVEDYTLYNMPMKLAREVVREDPALPGVWVRDEEWYIGVRHRFFKLIAFMQEGGLLKKKFVDDPQDIDGVKVRFSDLTDLGRLFVEKGFDEKWLDSLDKKSKSGNEEISTQYLERKLKGLTKIA
jgi:hypothetical protein